MSFVRRHRGGFCVAYQRQPIGDASFVVVVVDVVVVERACLILVFNILQYTAYTCIFFYKVIPQYRPTDATLAYGSVTIVPSHSHFDVGATTTTAAAPS